MEPGPTSEEPPELPVDFSSEAAGGGSGENSEEVVMDAPMQPCPVCEGLIEITDLEPLTLVSCPGCGAEVKVRGDVDHFELIDVAGSGGMGVVYKALDHSLHRKVALKLLRKDHSDNAELIKQLETEAAITAAINHPHVVNVFSTGTDRGRFYIAMELVDKGSLDDLIRIQGAVSEAQVLEVGIHIAKGLKAAHDYGLIHRDVKPGNILFADAHTAKIVDFGLAIFMSQEEDVRGEIWGTPYYVAPEKLDNKPEDFRSDIYSLGATLFHALAGRPPFEAENASMVALKHLKSQPVSLQAFAPRVSGRTAYIINRTLLKDPAQRYQSYDDLIEHFEYAREELLSSGTNDRDKKRVVMETAENQKAWGYITAATIAVIIVALVSIGVAWNHSRNTKPDEKVIKAIENAAGLSAPLEAALAVFTEGNAAGAVVEYNKIIDGKNSAPADIRLALLQKGIVELDQGKMADAQASFKHLGGVKSPGKLDDDGKKVEAVISDLAKQMSNDAPIDPKAYKDVAGNSPQVIELLVYGLKNWQLEKFDDSIKLLRQFRFSNPPSSCAWYAKLKPIASRYLDESTQLQMDVDRMNAEKVIDKKAAIALEVLKKAKGPFATRVKAAIPSDVVEHLQKQGKMPK